jgi:hypothetical protein
MTIGTDSAAGAAFFSAIALVSEPLLEVAFGSLATAFVIGVLYAGLRPKGAIGWAESGREWVRLWEVHPNFVAAVDGMRSAGAT